MQKHIHFYFVLATLFLMTTGIQTLSALPGVTQYIPDNSGEYIYYKDNSFQREAYIGFLYYDDGTYSVRYYAPAIKDTKNTQVEKEIEILFSLDPKKDYVELTGERILSSVTAEDTDIVNYMHDMMYELSARRKKQGTVSSVQTSQQDYAQFGGLVTIGFDPLVPIFNIKSISSSDGTTVLQSVEAGQLVSSQDKSFSSFKGFPKNFTDTKHQLKVKKNLKKANYEYKLDDERTQTIILDTQWSQSMDNFFLLGNSAILTMNIVKAPANSPITFSDLLTRKLILGTENSYPDWSRLKITKSDKRTVIENTYYQPLSGSVTKDFKIITPLSSGNYALLTLTVFTGAYLPNTDYFTAIINSYTIK